MPTTEGTTGRTGTVTIGQKVLTVGSLSLADERRLSRELAAMAKAEFGDYYTANKAMLEKADPRDRALMVRTLTEMVA